MIITPIHTRLLVPPNDDLLAVIRSALPRLKENSILVITSKVVSIWQGRAVAREKTEDKDALIIKEADHYLPRDVVPGKWIMHTIKNNIFIPTAGVDASNANDYYILWPDKPYETARELWKWIRKTYTVKNVGVIITDSHSIPLRRGTVGISVAHYGFTPIRDYRKKKDLFGRRFHGTQSNLVDGLAAAAVVTMGEGEESTPLALIQDLPSITFRTTPWRPQKPYSSLEVPWKEDIYRPFFGAVPWKKGKSGK